MSLNERTTRDLLKALVDDPENEELLNQTKQRILAGDQEFGHAAKALVPRPPVLHTFWRGLSLNYWCSCWSSLMHVLALDRWCKCLRSRRCWCNTIGEQCCHPVQIRYPRGLQDLIDAVNEGRKKDLTVRAVGSGHSFSDVAPTNGILLNPKRMNRILKVNSLREVASPPTLFAVESGITIKALNAALDKAGLALINMGAYDGQTLAGAISTGTHGSGLSLGPMASSVRSLVLVSETGKVYQIEPVNGITDPDKFAAANHANIELVQDDDWFNSTVIAMGCMGIIYSYVIEVVPRYYLNETRVLTNWEKVKPELAMKQGGPFPTVLTSSRYVGYDISPYVVKGAHSCIAETKTEVTADHSSGTRGIAYWLAGLLAGWPEAEHWLVWLLNTIPGISPEIIDSALSSLVDQNYIDKSFIVLSVGAVDNVKALAIELSYPVDENLVDNIDNLLLVFANEARDKKWYLAGPVALRFVAPSQAYLSPQEGRYTCMAELDMLVGINNGTDLLKAIKNSVRAGNPAVRVHWGLDLDTVDGNEVKESYSKFNNWHDVYTKLNSTGMFNSAFTDRLGISIKARAAEGV